MRKSALRKNILNLRNNLNIEEKHKKDKMIKDILFNDTDFICAKVILFYASFKSEVDTIGMLEEAIKLKKRIVLPFILSKKHKMLGISEIFALNELSLSNWGILEPTQINLIKFQDVDLIIVPGVVFDKYGYRLGYGEGYYDRLLKIKTLKKVIKIGLCYSLQLVDKISNVNKNDIPVDKIITEDGIIEAKTWK